MGFSGAGSWGKGQKARGYPRPRLDDLGNFKPLLGQGTLGTGYGSPSQVGSKTESLWNSIPGLKVPKQTRSYIPELSLQGDKALQRERFTKLFDPKVLRAAMGAPWVEEGGRKRPPKVRDRNGKDWDLEWVRGWHQYAFGQDLPNDQGEPEIFQYPGGNEYGLPNSGRFNKGQRDDQVARGAAQKKAAHDARFNPDGSLKTVSQGYRKYANETTEQWAKQISEWGFHPFISDMVAGTITAPLHFAAEMGTAGDMEEKMSTRLSAMANAAFALASTEAGGKFLKPMFEPVMKPLMRAARQYGEPSKEALRRFGRAMLDKKEKAMKIAIEELRIPAKQASNMLDEFYKRFKRTTKGTESNQARAGVAVSPIAEAGKKSGPLLRPKWVDAEALPQANVPVVSHKPGAKAARNAVEREFAIGYAKGGALDRTTESVLKGWIDRNVKGREGQGATDLMDFIVEFTDSMPGGARGGYDPVARHLYLAREFRNSPFKRGVLHNFVHEHAHHLQSFLTEADIAALTKQYEKEMKNDQFFKYKNAVTNRLGGYGERRYVTFSEWWADSVADMIHRTDFDPKLIEMDNQPELVKAWRRSLLRVRQTLIQARRQLLRRTKEDHVQRILDGILDSKSKRPDLGAEGPGIQKLLKDIEIEKTLKGGAG